MRIKFRLLPYKILTVVLLVSAFISGCATQPPMELPLTPAAYGPTPVTVPGFTPFAEPRTLTHIVGPSETLWRVSKIYDVDIQTLMNANNLRNANQLKNGQKLIIPNTFGPRPIVTCYPSKRWKYIIIHHTATDFGNAFEIDRMHHERGFWNGLGYHFLIGNGTRGTIMGQVEAGPRWIKQMDGAHTKAANMNLNGIGIALVGNFSETTVPEEQLQSLIYLVRTLQDYYKIPSSNVIGHGDVPGANTECPGKLFPWRRFKQALS